MYTHVLLYLAGQSCLVHTLTFNYNNLQLKIFCIGRSIVHFSIQTIVVNIIYGNRVMKLLLYTLIFINVSPLHKTSNVFSYYLIAINIM